MKFNYFIIVFIMLTCLSNVSLAQNLESQIDEIEHQIEENKKEYNKLKQDVNVLKLNLYKKNYKDLVGLPSDNYIEHKAMFLEYSEAHEQPAWVAHCISPEISELGSSRTNDFRIDPKIKTGTAVELDYFTKELQPDSTYEYDGYGYDRGHLAPSADFRWSADALSESYYYSNMSPQVPEFNREIWGELEELLRIYVITNNTHVYVVTAPILTDDSPKIDRSINGVSIPDKFVKVAVDVKNNQSIGFILRNEKASSPLDAFATTVDYVEEITGYNFFPKISESLESVLDKESWFINVEQKYVAPISPNRLKDGYFNTIKGGTKKGMRKKVKVCGTVVSSRNSRKGHAWLNLDRKYPNDYFSVMINKDNLINFDYNPVQALLNTEQCFEAEVDDLRKSPVMYISKQSQIKALNNI